MVVVAVDVVAPGEEAVDVNVRVRNEVRETSTQLELVGQTVLAHEMGNHLVGDQGPVVDVLQTDAIFEVEVRGEEVRVFIPSPLFQMFPERSIRSRNDVEFRRSRVPQFSLDLFVRL